MSAHRLYLGDVLESTDVGDTVNLDSASARRIAHVLRLGRGERLAVFGAGREFFAEVQTGPAESRVCLVEELAPARCERRPLTLYQGLIRPSRFEWVIEKGTELGVAGFVPVVTARTSVRPIEIGGARLERWRRIAIEATEQSGGRAPPSIGSPLRFESALSQAGSEIILAWEGIRGRPAGALVDRLRTGTGRLSLFVGPEGGFEEGEVARAEAAGAHLIGLGERTLRAETAAIVASALVLIG